MQTVANLDEDDADVIAHGKQQLLEVLGLSRGVVAEDAATDLGQSVDDLRNLRTEDILYVLGGVVGILDDIMEECGADAR